MSAREVLTEVWQAGREDVRETTHAQKALLGAAALGLVAEWTATEASLVAIGDAVFEATHSPLMTAIATGGSSFVEQSAFGLLTVASIQNFPNTFAAVREKREERRQRKANEQDDATAPAEVTGEDTKPVAEQPTHKKRGFLKRFGNAFALGTSLNTLVNNTSEEFSGKENVENVMSDAALIGLGVTALFGVGTEALSEQAASDILSSPLTYASVLTLVIGSRVVENIRKPKDIDS